MNDILTPHKNEDIVNLIEKLDKIRKSASLIILKEEVKKTTKKELDELERIDINSDIAKEANGKFNGEISETKSGIQKATEKLSSAKKRLRENDKLSHGKNMLRLIICVLAAFLVIPLFTYLYGAIGPAITLMIGAVYYAFLTIFMASTHILRDFNKSSQKKDNENRLKDRIEELEQRMGELKEKSKELSQAKAAFIEEKRKAFDEKVNGLKTALKNLDSEIEELTLKLNAEQGELILLREDWKHIDQIIFMLSSGRAESIKDCLKQIDLHEKLSEIADSIQKNLNENANKVNATVSVGVSHIEDSIHGLAGIQKDMVETMSAIASDMALAQEKTNEAMKELIASTETNRKMADDIHDMHNKYNYNT